MSSLDHQVESHSNRSLSVEPQPRVRARTTSAGRMLLLQPEQRSMVVKSWTELGEATRQQAVSNAFCEIMLRSNEIRSAFKIGSVNNRAQLVETPNFKKHVQRFRDFLDKAIDDLQMGPSCDHKVFELCKQVSLRHVNIQGMAWGATNFLYFINAVSENVSAVSDHPSEPVRKAWKSLLKLIVAEMRDKLYKLQTRKHNFMPHMNKHFED